MAASLFHGYIYHLPTFPTTYRFRVNVHQMESSLNLPVDDEVYLNYIFDVENLGSRYTGCSSGTSKAILLKPETENAPIIPSGYLLTIHNHASENDCIVIKCSVGIPNMDFSIDPSILTNQTTACAQDNAPTQEVVVQPPVQSQSQMDLAPTQEVVVQPQSQMDLAPTQEVVVQPQSQMDLAPTQEVVVQPQPQPQSQMDLAPTQNTFDWQNISEVQSVPDSTNNNNTQSSPDASVLDINLDDPWFQHIIHSDKQADQTPIDFESIFK
ncbi:hypothetical protein TetV_063 [Tetraselmis virus 1]|uniref:Uncharacterized protein n=1 Tax=Tetraselmis virus 1 TaxID=2060617 RepID=A0A2P0VMN0_9VIRU|nr:hypothetical protein QJ968_gp063 [Tetraselmis virus 1]AUF82155.1 hypothetical protein TetV_063 [Tetraselmis virus 1]